MLYLRCTFAGLCYQPEMSFPYSPAFTGRKLKVYGQQYRKEREKCNLPLAYTVHRRLKPNFPKKSIDYFIILCYYISCSDAGVVQWLESQPSKLVVWVRFPSPAPKEKSLSGGFFIFR